MRSIKTTTAVLLFACITLLAISCKKDPPPTQSKIVAKWQIQSVVENYFFSGSAHVNTISGPADYADFRADNKLYSFSQNYYDTAAYGLISDSKIWIDVNTDIYDVQTLTDTQLKLYIKETIAPGEYTETTINCSK